MKTEYTTTGTGTTDWWTSVVEFKPVGRGRHFERLRRGLAKRMRIPFVRETLWEVAHPQSTTGAMTYGPMWLSTNALARCTFSCTCHPNERYSRKRKHRKRDR